MRYLLSKGTTVVLYYGDADYNVPWVGGELVAEGVGAPGFSQAGYAKINTNDGVTHGEVKQAGGFSFVRVYEAGHKAPFYQPLLMFEVFNRAINGLDIETGKVEAGPSYRTCGPAKSLYREGNSTVQFDDVSANLTYDVNTNQPGKPWNATGL